MPTSCKNCQTAFTGKFCPECGQEATTHKINLHFMWHDIQHGLFHMDKGILFTIKELFTRPGHTIREFIDGKRVKHFKPISLVIVLSTIYGYLYVHFHISEVSEITTTNEGLTKNQLTEINNFLGSHLYLFELFALNLFALASFLVFNKQRYNFTEHLIMNAYLAGQRLFISILTFPILLYFNQIHHLKNLTFLSLLINFCLMYWSYSQIFNNLSKTKTFFLSLTSFFLFLALFFILVFIIAAIRLLIN